MLSSLLRRRIDSSRARLDAVSSQPLYRPAERECTDSVGEIQPEPVDSLICRINRHIHQSRVPEPQAHMGYFLPCVRLLIYRSSYPY